MKCCMMERQEHRGEMINRRAELGSHIVAMRVRIPELEKLARRTPSKTLFAEKAKVEAAKVQLAECRKQLPLMEAEWATLKAKLGARPGERPGETPMGMMQEFKVDDE